jgi:hypothetical protein
VHARRARHAIERCAQLLLDIVAHDIKEFEAFYLDHLSHIPLVQSVNSTMVVTALKKTTALPLAPVVAPRPGEAPGLTVRAGTPPRR